MRIIPQFVARIFRLLGVAWSLTLAVSSWMCSGAQEPSVARTPARQPNIVFILADDLGYGDLGCYGQKRIRTPNIDRLAADGMRFTDFYAGCTVCAPSRCALMTGLHSGHCLVRGNAKVSLRPEDFTLAEMLKRAGYRTALIGKWGLGNEGTTGTPRQKGFDEFVGYLDQTHAHDYYTTNLDRYDVTTGFEGKIPLTGNLDGKQGVYTPDLFITAALNFIANNTPDRSNHFRPFFLEFATIIPHANNEEGRRTGNGMQIPTDAPYSREQWPQVERNKAAMITRLDTDVGKIVDKLKELKLADRTLVIFTSDNGPHKEGGVDPQYFDSAGPLRGIKRDLYEGGIRVPLLIRWQGKVKTGQVADFASAFWDFMPTFADLADQKLPVQTDGISFLPTLLGQPQNNHHDFLYWEFHEGGFQQAVRMGDWKAVKPAPDKKLELYDLRSDVGEKQDIASKNTEVVTKIEAYLKTARTESPLWPAH